MSFDHGESCRVVDQITISQPRCLTRQLQQLQQRQQEEPLCRLLRQYLRCENMVLETTTSSDDDNESQKGENEQTSSSAEDFRLLVFSIASCRPDILISKKRKELMDTALQVLQSSPDCRRILSEWKGAQRNFVAVYSVCLVQATIIDARSCRLATANSP